ncbi:hypothetical protein niasHT_007440 [Heterodera trifolii]|uniref:Ig-like domain-containing protein n=1 Tax=Heterodera trifolii TaxID=157864 RepID=A0ABD2LNA1_9BILA
MHDSVLPCFLNASDEIGFDRIEWWYKGYGQTFIGFSDARNKTAQTKWARDGDYEVMDNGTLAIRRARRALVERYHCVVFTNGTVPPLLHVLLFRLDFSSWYALEPGSLFLGSCLAAIVFCAASFLLNIIWIICRKIILWWIKRTERLSRIRAFMEALEKYRQKQMDSLHETYSRRVSAIRDNYHSQVDQLRQSYADSADRFRDYRQAQIDHVQQHLDSIRDNYSQQMGRLREFGSRRVERIWESYDRNISALRTFTMEQRLRMMNQCKVKQRYVNKLLEAIAAETNAEVINRKEAAIREALGEAEPPWLHPHASSSCASIARSDSYYSLPEFVMEEDEWEMVLETNTKGGAGDEENGGRGEAKWQCTVATQSGTDRRAQGVRFTEVKVHGREETVAEKETDKEKDSADE